MLVLDLGADLFEFGTVMNGDLSSHAERYVIELD